MTIHDQWHRNLSGSSINSAASEHNGQFPIRTGLGGWPVILFQIIDLQYLVPVVVDHLDGDPAAMRYEEPPALGAVKALPRRLVNLSLSVLFNDPYGLSAPVKYAWRTKNAYPL
jgi:hypothetical protein